MHENYPSKLHRQLINAFTQLKTKVEVQAFLRDILTIGEINEISGRFEIARLLWLGHKSYLQIANQVGVSTTTVTRVADWLFNKNLKGYQTALNRLFPQNPPPRKPAKGSKPLSPSKR